MMEEKNEDKRKEESIGDKQKTAEELVEEIKEENSGNKKEDKEKQNKQTMWAVILMLSIILIIILIPIVRYNFFDNFTYFNLNFQKTKLGEIFFYSTRIPIVDNSGEIVNEYTMNFRNNPKKLEEIEFNYPEIGDVSYIYFKKDKPVYISLDPEMQACEDNSIALIPFSGFLRNFAKQNVSSAVSDEDYAKENSLVYANCESHPESTVIYINSGEETRIDKNKRNCYELTYADCEIFKVTEKFELLVLEKYMSYFVRKEEGSFFEDIFK